MLENGPKYSYQPSATRSQLVAIVRDVASRASEPDRERAIADGVDCLLRTVSDKPGKKPPIKKIVKCLKEEGLAVVEADKEGGFVLMPKGLFNAKAQEAIQKNFKPSNVLPKKQKSLALRLLKERNLKTLQKEVSKSVKDSLDVFFTGKTHKTAQSDRLREGHVARRGQQLSATMPRQAGRTGPVLGAQFDRPSTRSSARQVGNRQDCFFF